MLGRMGRGIGAGLMRAGFFLGGFEASQSSRRLKHFVPTRSHINSLIQAVGPDITARARWLVRNNGYARKAVESWAGAMVGAGVKPNSKVSDADLKRRIQDLWLEWTDEADAEGVTDYYGMQRRAAREMMIAGEVFARMRTPKNVGATGVPFNLQLLPSEMLPFNDNRELKDGAAVRQGIEFDSDGRRVAYHFLKRHPGDSTEPGLAGETVRVPASEVLHLYDPVDAGQIRGVSAFSAAIVKLFILDQYDDAELDRKKVAALFSVFIRTKEPEGILDEIAAPSSSAGQSGSGDVDKNIDLQPGLVAALDMNEEISVAEPADVGGNYEQFQYRTILQISAALNIPYPFLSNDIVKANFSSMRISLIEFRRLIEAAQHSVFVPQFCRPVWLRFIEVATLSGALDLPDYSERRREYASVEWLPARWEWIDPLKDVNAEIEQIEAGLKSRRQAVAERGYDVESLDDEIAADKERERQLGLSFSSDASNETPNDPTPAVTDGEVDDEKGDDTAASDEDGADEDESEEDDD